MVNWFLKMALLQYITFCCKQLPLIGQEDLALQLQEDFDDFDSLLRMTFLLRDFIMLDIFDIQL